ncbi:MAG: 16S rRNA (guanine(527)-N(7))-methyltransferase RsmG [Brachybacterium paraconglomeratum]|nr:16S rRNA (guanine(527)-N(7))-methyltransferase RsmG [Brachybacterium paraconglomeratum]
MPLAERYADLLAHDGVVRGLIGPREVPRLWERHLLNCALLGRAIPEGATVCDIGSGAGLPGIVLALSRPDLQVTLVEPLLRRTTFLEEVVTELGLPNVEVVRGRAEELHGRAEFDAVTSRAVAPLDRLLAWSMPLVRQGGALVAMKGSSVEDEIEAASKALAKHGAGAVVVRRLGEGVVDHPTTVVRVEATRPSRLGLAPQCSARGNSATRARGKAASKSPSKSPSKTRGRGSEGRRRKEG